LKELHLTRPSEYELSDAYRRLPKGGNVLIDVDRESIREYLLKLEKIGFVAIELPFYNIHEKIATISGFKGKHGPCYASGRKARYTGSALAALDDDNHMLVSGSEVEVCEKTAGVYCFSPYDGLISVSGGTTDLLDTLEAEPVKFDRNTFDEDMHQLYFLTKDSIIESDRVMAFYPGPFKLLILSDGTVVKRGKYTSIPVKELAGLTETDRIHPAEGLTLEAPVFLQDIFAEQGSSCLFDDIRLESQDTPESAPDLEVLDPGDRILVPRLRDMIEKGRQYFILTGSDPSDEFGCCPSDEVGAANRLVKAGILSALSQVQVQQDACPVTYYAFRGEIRASSGGIEFEKNEELRALLRDRMKADKSLIVKGLIKWLLLGFVAVSLVLAVLRLTGFKDKNEQHSLYEQLLPMNPDAILILLFHNQVRCTMCRNMEDHIQSLLSEEYKDMLSAGRMEFFLMNMNLSENLALVRRYGLYTASVVVVRLADEKEQHAIVLEDIWKYHEDESEFKKRLNNP